MAGVPIDAAACKVVILRDPIPLSMRSVLFSSNRRVLLLICGVVVLFGGAVNSASIALAQEEPELASALIGHWRNTKIVFEKPQDTHLLLHPDGTVETWVVTATKRDQKTAGRWSSNGKTLTLAFGSGDERSYPFTFYLGAACAAEYCEQAAILGEDLSSRPASLVSSRFRIRAGIRGLYTMVAITVTRAVAIETGRRHSAHRTNVDILCFLHEHQTDNQRNRRGDHRIP